MVISLILVKWLLASCVTRKRNKQNVKNENQSKEISRLRKKNESKIKTAAMTWEKSKTKRIKEITKLATYTEKVFTKK